MSILPIIFSLAFVFVVAQARERYEQHYCQSEEFGIAMLRVWRAAIEKH